MKKRKGKLEEILSKAKFYDDIDLYKVSYRDFDTIVSVTLEEFIFLSSNFESIPSNRIKIRTIRRIEHLEFLKIKESD